MGERKKYTTGDVVWSADSDYVIEDAGHFLATVWNYWASGGRSFYKTYDGACVAVFCSNFPSNKGGLKTGRYDGPLLLSPVKSNAVYTQNSANSTIEYMGSTWYYSWGWWLERPVDNIVTSLPVIDCSAHTVLTQDVAVMQCLIVAGVVVGGDPEPFKVFVGWNAPNGKSLKTSMELNVVK